MFYPDFLANIVIDNVTTRLECLQVTEVQLSCGFSIASVYFQDRRLRIYSFIFLICNCLAISKHVCLSLQQQQQQHHN